MVDRLRQLVIATLFPLLFANCLSAKTNTKPSAASKQVQSGTHSRSKRSAKRSSRGSWKKHGQQAIKRDRAREIQEALIREHYLQGAPTGVWDARTQAAMRRYQADQNWQTRIVPDSRALIKLGLGPNPQTNSTLIGETRAANASAATPPQ